MPIDNVIIVLYLIINFFIFELGIRNKLILDDNRDSISAPHVLAVCSIFKSTYPDCKNLGVIIPSSSIYPLAELI